MAPSLGIICVPDEEKSPPDTVFYSSARTFVTEESSMPVKMASSGGGQLSGQVVLVLQGGGALGAYQVGVYQALHEAGIEPDWVIGTSIGAINGAIIAGNPPDKRLERLTQFWDLVQLKQYGNLGAIWSAFASL